MGRGKLPKSSLGTRVAVLFEKCFEQVMPGPFGFLWQLRSTQNRWRRWLTILPQRCVCHLLMLSSLPTWVQASVCRDHTYLFYIGISKVPLSLQSPSSCSDMLALVSRKIQGQRDRLSGQQDQVQSKGITFETESRVAHVAFELVVQPRMALNSLIVFFSCFLPTYQVLGYSHGSLHQLLVSLPCCIKMFI